MAATNTKNQIAAPCAFTDRVPPEIRNEIFSYVLSKQKAIHFRYVLPRDKTGKCNKKWVAYPAIAYNPKTGRSERQIHFAALLATCKLFHAEASETLFGCNKFAFPSTTAATQFLTTYGGPTHAIRAIEVDQYVQGTAKAFCTSLLPLQSLRSVSLPHAGLCQNRDKSIKLSLLQHHMKPLLRSLRTSHEHRQQFIDLQDLVKIHDAYGYQHCWLCVKKNPQWEQLHPHNPQEYRRMQSAECEKLKQQVRELIAAALA